MRSPVGGAESECGTGRVLQDRLNQLHEGLASKEKHRKAKSLSSANAKTITTQSTLMVMMHGKHDTKLMKPDCQISRAVNKSTQKNGNSIISGNIITSSIPAVVQQ